MGLWWRKRSGPGSERDESLPLVRLDNVFKNFEGDADEDTVALAGVSLDIDRGEYVSVSGPSGCGKSTFLSILALLETPSSGLYWLNGRRTDLLTPAERARARSLDVGLVFQSFNLIGDMTVYENVLLADEPTGNLDSKSGDALMDMLSELHAGGATVVLATHNPLYIARAQRHIYLFDGRVTAEPV